MLQEESDIKNHSEQSFMMKMVLLQAREQSHGPLLIISIIPGQNMQALVLKMKLYMMVWFVITR
jgi:hypothetical protein